MRKYKIIKLVQDGKDYYGIFEAIVDGDNINILGTQPINNVFFESLEELYEYLEDFYNQLSDYKNNNTPVLMEDDVNFVEADMPDGCGCEDGCDCEDDDGEWTSYHDHDHDHHHDKGHCCGGKGGADCKCGF